ncbi:MAG: signal recognition particle protein Srp19, partial [Candidatus Woesearchaeota archaeon]|nr:signal recognition particle protein Srp19 [Candidatus Woesearchaeota archaeon]
TAGRDALSDDLIKEIEDITNYTKPDEKLLVISADVGQAAQAQAEQFHKSCKITGVITTRMDGTAKAGGALTACAVTGAPIKFIGVGEKLSDLEPFNPQGFIGRLLGMGDLEALLDKAKDAITQEDAEDLGKKLLKGEFNLIDLYEQMQAMKKMGPLSKVVEMIPGMGQMKMPKEMLDNQDVKLDNWRYLMNSMTKEELEDPELITADRMERIAKGSGRSLSDIREMVKQFRQSKKMLKMVKGQDPEKLMKKLGGMQSKGMGKVKYK